MNEKNMLEQNPRDIMRHLGFRQTANAMDKIDPLPFPEAATPWKTASDSMWSTPAIAAVMGKAALDGMTAHETKMGEAVMAKLRDKLSTQPIADALNEEAKKRVMDAAFGGKDFKMLTRRLSPDEDAELIAKLREKLTDDEIQLLSGPYLPAQPIEAILGDLFAPSMGTDVMVDVDMP